MMHVLFVALCFLAFSTCLASDALAEDRTQAHAEELFRDGRQKLLDGNPDEACPLLQSSYDLDPGTGTLLALAICREREGRLATAWRGYRLVAERSQADGRVDREQAANARAAELEAQLSIVTLTFSEDWLKSAQDVRLSYDGVAIGIAATGTSVPLDGGEHVFRLTASDRVPWETRLTVLPQGDRRTIAVPELPLESPASTPDRAPAAPPVVPRAQQRRAAPKAAPEPSTRLSPLQTTAIGVGAAGLATLGVGAVFVVRALDKNADSNRGCYDDACTPSAKADRMDARFSGDVATVAFTAGGVLMGAAALLFAIGHDPRPTASAARQGLPTSPHVSISVCPISAGIAVRGDL